MLAHLSLIYQAIVVAIGTAALLVSIRRAIRSGRDDHRGFALFWGVFTALLVSELIGEYLFLNLNSLTPTGGLLVNALNLNLNYVMVTAVAYYLHALGGVRGHRFRNGVFLVALFASVVAASPPWGIGFIESSWTIAIRAGFWIGSIYYLGSLAYASAYAWLFVFTRPGTDSRVFLVGMAVFATAGLAESLVGTIGTLANPTLTMGVGRVMVSTIPYLVYAIFLLVHGGVEETTPSQASVQAPPTDGFEFSDREREVVSLLCAGYSNQKIADELYISLATVKTHLYRVYRKAGVPSRLGLVRALESRN